ncbi:hypothetical protein [Caulobacter soli]|uniref:hypothetical protein n=1 Tax=Caulobacter soli TaxID=2708539 RepID=UPI0013EC3F34|nr:hypothetical protein [Caulobacter soli]
MANLTVSLIIRTLASLAGLKAATKATGDLSKVTGAAVNPVKALGAATDASKRITKAEAEAIMEDLRAKRLGTKATEELGQAVEATSRRTVSFAARLRLARMRTTEFRAGIGRGFTTALWAGGGAITALASGAVLATSWLGRATLAQAKVAKETRNAAQAAGIGTREYQRLNYAFETSGGTGVELGDALKFLNQNQVRAARGGKDQRVAFQALGVSYMKTSRQLQPAEVLLGRIADRFKVMPNGAKKAAIAQMLFGDSGVALIPVLNRGSAELKALGDEAERFGLVLSDEAVAKSAALDLQWLRTTKMIKGLRDALVTALLPAFSDLVGWLEKTLQRDRQKILSQINAGVAALKANLPSILKTLGELWAVLGFIAGVGSKVVKAIGGVSGAFDFLAGIMIGRLAIGTIQLIGLLWGVNGALWAFPGTWIVAVIAGLIFGTILLIRHWGAVKAFFGDLWVHFKTWFTSLPIWAQALISLPATIITHWNEIIGFFKGVFGQLKAVFATGVADIWNSLPPWFQNAIRVGAIVANPVAALGYAMSAPRPSGAAAPTAAVGARSNQLNGSITVVAGPGTQVRDAQSDTPGVGFDLSRGMTLPAF